MLLEPLLMRFLQWIYDVTIYLHLIIRKLAINASGVSVYKHGGWVERIYGRKKRYIKIHFAVDVKTRGY